MQIKNTRPGHQGLVYIAGAGPGDPDLITVKALKVLKNADTVVYDRLVNPELLAHSPDNSEHIYVGKKPGKPSVSQDQINRILISKARENKIVVRLKGGDPFIFGRGGEECEALASAHIPYEVIPGISSALSAPAFAGIPLTHRNLGRSFTVVTGHTLKNANLFQNWDHIAHADTLVILMGMKNLKKIVETLTAFGRPADTPVSIIQKATFDEQQVVTATLNTIVEKSQEFGSPSTIVVGELAAMSHDLAWFKPAKHSGHQRNSTYNGRIAKFAG